MTLLPLNLIHVVKLTGFSRSVGLCSFSEEIPNEENEINNDNMSKNNESKPEGSPPLLHKKVVPNNALPSPGNHDTPISVSAGFYSLRAVGLERIHTPRFLFLRYFENGKDALENKYKI